MNPFLLFCFFIVVMGSVAAGGYLLLNRQSAGAPDNLADPAPQRLLPKLLLRVGEAVPGGPAKSGKLERQLLLAGYRRPNAVQIFTGIRIASALSLGLLAVIAKALFLPDSPGTLIAPMCWAGLGYLVPDRYLEFRIKARAQQLLEGIPTAVDLLVLSLEAGQSLDSSIMDVARELRNGFPALAAELSRVQMEIMASRGRGDVFKSLRDTTPQPELKRVAQVFIDSDRFGTGLAPALRQHVKYLRLRLRQQAQEQARKVGVKLIFPVFFLIFPAVILVTLGPAVIQVYNQLGAMMDLK
jgi:tight adherence protein C